MRKRPFIGDADCQLDVALAVEKWNNKIMAVGALVDQYISKTGKMPPNAGAVYEHLGAECRSEVRAILKKAKAGHDR